MKRTAVVAAVVLMLAGSVAVERSQAEGFGCFDFNSYFIDAWELQFVHDFTWTNYSEWVPHGGLYGADYIAMRKAPNGSYPYQAFVPGGAHHWGPWPPNPVDVWRRTAFGNQTWQSGYVSMYQYAEGNCR